MVRLCEPNMRAVDRRLTTSLRIFKAAATLLIGVFIFSIAVDLVSEKQVLHSLQINSCLVPLLIVRYPLDTDVFDEPQFGHLGKPSFLMRPLNHKMHVMKRGGRII